MKQEPRDIKVAPDRSPNVRLGGRLSFVEHFSVLQGKVRKGPAAWQPKTKGVGSHAGPGGRGRRQGQGQGPSPTPGAAPPPPRDSVRSALRLATRWSLAPIGAPGTFPGQLPEPEGAGSGWRRGSAAAGAGPGEDRKLGLSSRALGHCRGAGTGRCRRITFQGACSSSFPPAISRGHFMD